MRAVVAGPHVYVAGTAPIMADGSAPHPQKVRCRFASPTGGSGLTSEVQHLLRYRLWLAALIWMRSRQNPRREWNWVFPLALLLVAAAWVRPQAWDLGLVYLHPLVALTFLDREIAARRPEWRTAYRCCLALLPVLLGLLWWRLASSPPLPGDNGMSLSGFEAAAKLFDISSEEAMRLFDPTYYSKRMGAIAELAVAKKNATDQLKQLQTQSASIEIP